MFTIRVRSSSGLAFVHRLSQAETSIGRDAKNGVPLDDASAPRRHPLWQSTCVTVIRTDLSSRSGTHR